MQIAAEANVPAKNVHWVGNEQEGEDIAGVVDRVDQLVQGGQSVFMVVVSDYERPLNNRFASKPASLTVAIVSSGFVHPQELFQILSNVNFRGGRFNFYFYRLELGLEEGKETVWAVRRSA